MASALANSNYNRAPSSGRNLLRFGDAQSRVGLALLLFAALYNTLLAIVVAHGVNIGFTVVAAVETVITLATVVLSLSIGVTRRDIGPIALVWFIAVLGIVSSIAYEKVYIGSIRNFAIIAAFSLLGQRMRLRDIRLAFFAVSMTALLVLFWEIVSVESYAAFFSPAHYYEVTRGTATDEFNTSGLSNGTVVFNGRFSLGIFSGARTSSIFLEQVSINAYAIVCMVFLNGLWSKISWIERLVPLLLIFLIVATNNARMAALMCLVMPVGYFVFPLLHRTIIPLMPFSIILGLFIVSPYIANVYSDDLTGRLGVTYRLLSDFEASEIFAGNPLKVDRMFDSGYAFILASVGIFGGLAYLAYLTGYTKFNTVDQKRGSWSAAVYVILWLTIGGTATFSIKTAALLWALLGYLGSMPPLDREGSHLDPSELGPRSRARPLEDRQARDHGSRG
jgi:putative polymerase